MYEDLTEVFNRFYEKYKDKRIIFCGHRHSDIDAIASAYALSEAFPNSIVAYVDEMDTPAKHLCETMGIKANDIKEINLDEYDGVVAVDTSSSILMPIDKSKIIGIFDHHTENENTIKAKFEIKDENARSTAEIVANVMGFKFNKNVATALATAIISDTYRFITASHTTLETFNKLMNMSGKEYEELLNLAYPKRHYDEVNAILTAFKRAEWEEINGYTIVWSHVSSAGSSAAGKLAEVGDIAIVVSWDEKLNATKVSLRGGPFEPLRLDKVANHLGKIFSGGGGGHPKAAGALCREKPEVVLRYGVQLIKERLKSLN